MKAEIRKHLEKKMAEQKQEPVGTYLSPEQFQQLLGAITSAPKMNPLEEKKLKDELERQRRRDLLAVELGKVEEEARFRKQNSCPHSRDRTTGDFVAKGTGVWTTSGQVHGNGTITLLCMRCQTEWKWQATPAEIQSAIDAGLLGMAPPPVDRCLNKEDFVQRPAPQIQTA